MKLKAAIIAASIALFCPANQDVAVAADVTLKVISAYPKTNNFNTSLLALIDEVNAAPESGVKLQFIGGPEVLPSGEMLQALGSGVVDIFYGSTSVFLGEIPEAAALNGSNQSAMALRASGALDLLNKSFEGRLNSTYLGYYGSGYTFYVYLLREPKTTENGGIDLRGWKIRGVAPFQTLIDKLGSVMIGLFIPDIYSAMERGVIDGLVWTSVSVAVQGWDKFIKYRVKPGFWQGDISIVANRSKWASLTDKQRAFLTEKIVKYERIAHEGYAEQAAADEAKLRAAGMKDIVLEGDARKAFLEAPVELFWDGLRTGKKIPPEQVDRLRAAFYKP